MTARILRLVGGVVAVVSVTLSAQAPPLRPVQIHERPAERPDLFGVWDFATVTPLQRPDGVKGSTFSDAELKAFMSQIQAIEGTRGRPDGKGGLTNGNYPRVFMDDGESLIGGNRSSLIIDPPDGRIPYSPEARKRMQAARAAVTGTVDNPEDLGLAARCLVGFNAGPPMTPLSAIGEAPRMAEILRPIEKQFGDTDR